MKRHLLPLIVSGIFCTPALAHESATGEYGKLGKVTFANSCDPSIQEDLQRAVAMLHSFWFVAAEKSFAELMKRDPSCVIARWGYASILMSNPLAGQGALPANVPKAQAAIDEARKTGAKTEREREYLEAVAAYYEDFANRPERARQLARAKAYEALAAKYRDDDEAQIFSALYTAGTQQQSDQTYGAYLKAAGALETQFKKYPDHPGVAHYLIHSYDAPPIAAKGLNAARIYASIAPDAPHALHMPSHIFTRVGSWEESAATNLRSAAVAAKSGEADEYCHAHDYAVYAYLQLGRDEDARRAVEEGAKVPTATKLFVGPYALVAMPARFALERSDWKAAMNLPVPATPFPQNNAQGHFARALGAIRSGNPAAAAKDAEALGEIEKKLVEAKNAYWAKEVETQRLTIAAWTAHAGGNPAEGLKLMRAAADLEDSNEKHIVTPGRMLPARELLGEMLIEQKQPAAAMKELEASQAREPNRYRNYAACAQAAEMMGDKAKAREYYAKLLELAKKGDGKRPELIRAKAFVAQR